MKSAESMFGLLSGLVVGSMFVLYPLQPNAQTLAIMPVEQKTDQVDTDTAKPKKPKVTLFASGAVRDAIGKTSDSSSSSGSLGIMRSSDKWTVTAQVTVAGAFDTLSEGLGQAMLTLASGRSLNAGLIDYRCRHVFRGEDDFIRRLGVHAYGSISTARWSTGADSEGVNSEEVLGPTTDVPIGALGCALSLEFLNDQIDGNNFLIVLDAGLTCRRLFGDLSGDEHRSLREELLGSDKVFFSGAELGLSVQFNQFTAGMSAIFLDGDIRGLGHGQIMAGIGVHTSIVPPPK